MPVDTALLDDLLRRMQAAGLSELEVEDGRQRIAMRLAGATSSEPQTSDETITVRSTGIGHFRAVHPRGTTPALKPGDAVSIGQVLGFIEAGATLTGIVVPSGGTITGVEVADGALLGFGDAVFLLGSGV